MSTMPNFWLPKLVCLAAALCPAWSSAAPATAFSNLDKVLSASAQLSSVPAGISETRAQALRQLGVGLGMRAGLADESRLIIDEIEKSKTDLDTKFNFGALTFSNGVLPPVVEEARDVIAITDYSMRIKGRVYRIVTPASFNQNNWRNYLYLGLLASDDPIVGEAQRTVLPKDSAEKTYWESIVRKAHEEGRKQSRKTFELNLARLERDYNGMNLFRELHRRNLVSAPSFAVATDSVARPDPNTIIIGESIFRITAQPEFIADDSKWKATK